MPVFSLAEKLVISTQLFLDYIYLYVHSLVTLAACWEVTQVEILPLSMLGFALDII